MFNFLYELTVISATPSRYSASVQFRWKSRLLQFDHPIISATPRAIMLSLTVVVTTAGAGSPPYMQYMQHGFRGRRGLGTRCGYHELHPKIDDLALSKGNSPAPSQATPRTRRAFMSAYQSLQVPFVSGLNLFSKMHPHLEQHHSGTCSMQAFSLLPRIRKPPERNDARIWGNTFSLMVCP
jgi:hypothetical protein